jgi:hypothetical protein
MNSCRRANGNHILFTRVSSNLPTFLGGTQVNPFYLTNVPPILASKFFPPPGQQDKLLPSRFEFLHSFPFTKGGLGGISTETNYFPPHPALSSNRARSVLGKEAVIPAKLVPAKAGSGNLIQTQLIACHCEKRSDEASRGKKRLPRSSGSQ